MTVLESVVLKPSVAWTRRIHNLEVCLTAISNDANLPYDVTLHAFGQSHNYRRFAQLAVAEKPGSFVGNIEIAMQQDRLPFAAVVGIYQVIFLNFLARSVKEPLKLFRKETDDKGFYRMQLHPIPDGFLINYESGIARMQETGEVLWHRKMVWNDVFLREEGAALLFHNENNPKGFFISISDGSKTPV